MGSSSNSCLLCMLLYINLSLVVLEGARSGLTVKHDIIGNLLTPIALLPSILLSLGVTSVTEGGHNGGSSEQTVVAPNRRTLPLLLYTSALFFVLQRRVSLSRYIILARCVITRLLMAKKHSSGWDWCFLMTHSPHRHNGGEVHTRASYLHSV